MSYRVIIFCPDSHITYNLWTLNDIGVGGGITARLRMAHALARHGNDVTACINCPTDECILGVNYIHYNHIEKLSGDILVASTSGGSLNLADIKHIEMDVRLKILQVHGVDFPANVRMNDFDYIYLVSNFLREIAVYRWNANPRKLFVSHHGVEPDEPGCGPFVQNDPYKLVYFSHPSKGLMAAIQVLRILRKTDRRFNLHVFGGNRLWGMEEQPFPIMDGLHYHGLVGQKELATRIREMGFSINLQSREEPFGMVITESMRAGCIVLASPVGAYPELIINGWNGLLVPGDSSEIETCELAAGMILDLVHHPDRMETIKLNAINTPVSWDTAALSWTRHWDYLHDGHLRPLPKDISELLQCPLCGGKSLDLPDGYHCLSCGHFHHRNKPVSNQQNRLSARLFI